MTQTKTVLNFSRNNPQVMVIAHRGSWNNAPENSILSVEHSIQAGTDIVEIDTQKCATGEFIVIHDETLDRTTNGTGPVSMLSLKQIKALRLKHRDGGDHNGLSDHNLPLLSELLAYAKGKIMVNIDAKHPEDLPEIIKEVERLEMQDTAIVKSRYYPSNGKWDALNSTVKHMPMLRSQQGQLIKDLERITAEQPFMIELAFHDIEELREAIPLLEKMDCRIWINTLDLSFPLAFSDTEAEANPEKIWGTLIEAGVGAIQTDLPEMLKKWLNLRSDVNP